MSAFADGGVAGELGCARPEVPQVELVKAPRRLAGLSSFVARLQPLPASAVYVVLMCLLRSLAGTFGTGTGIRALFGLRDTPEDARMPPLPRRIEPQLLSLAREVPTGAGWIHELKYDGYRLHVRLEAGTVRLITRGGHDWAERMPSIVQCAAGLDAETAYLDGELVVLDAQGLPDFDALHLHIRSKRKRAPGLLAVQAFDLLHLDGEDLRGRPLLERKAALAELLARSPAAAPALRYVDHLESAGDRFLQAVRERGLEGIVCKRAGSRYRPGTRAAEWVKVKCFERYDMVAVGYTGSLGSVLLASEEQGRLRYVGRVKGWIAPRTEASLFAALTERETDAWALPGSAPAVKGARWVRPELTVTVTALPREDSEPLRHATLRGWRPRNVLKIV